MSSYRTFIAALISAAGAVLLTILFFVLLGNPSTGSEKKPASDIVPPVSLKVIIPTEENASNGESANEPESEKEPAPEKTESETTEPETTPAEAVPPESAESEPELNPAPASGPVPEPESPSEENIPGRWLALEQGQFDISEPLRAELDLPVFKKRLPNGYGALELTEEQRAEIYAIQENYHRVLTPLYMRADRLRAERDEQIRAVLTENQLRLYSERKKK